MNSHIVIFGKEINLTRSELLTGGIAFLLGIFLILFPGVTASIILSGIAIGCILLGIFFVVRYFSLQTKDAAFGNALVLGLTLFTAGILLFAVPGLYDLLNLIVGLMLVIAGFFKLQAALNCKRIGIESKWMMLFVFALISILCGVLIMLNIYSSIELLLTVIGVVLVVESILDLISCATNRRILDNYQKSFME